MIAKNKKSKLLKPLIISEFKLKTFLKSIFFCFIHNLIEFNVSWNEYEALWTSDKMIVCEEFVSRGLPLVHIDEKFLFYTNIVECMDTIQPLHDIGPVRLNLNALIDSIRSYAVDWKNTLGEILIEKTLKTLKTLQKRMTVRVCLF